MPKLEDYYNIIDYGICFHFTGSNRGMDDCVLHVLPGKEESFANAWSWARFKHIVGDLSEGGGIPGDVNCDGSVNAADVTALYSFILNGNTTYEATSDVNGDNSINAADVTAVYKIILGQH